MKFLKACNEILTSYTPLRISKADATSFEVEYQVDEVYYRLVAINVLGDWSVFFDAQLNIHTDKPIAASVMTNPSIVLSNYLKAFDLFITGNSPTTFAFHTNNDSVRRGVFDNIMRKVAKSVEGKYRYIGRLTKDYTQRYIFAKEDNK